MGRYSLEMSRRRLLRSIGLGTFGGVLLARELGAGPSFERYLARLAATADGYDLDARIKIAQAIRGGIPLLGWLQAQRAYAQTGNAPWSVIHIKVVNHVATQLLFRLGQPDFDTGLATNSSDRSGVSINGQDINPLIFSKMAFGSVQETLSREGLGRLSAIPLGLAGSDAGATYGNRFRLNDWFAKILHDPSSASGSSFYPAEFLAGSATFDHSRVGLQFALGLGQTRGGNHSLKNFKLRRDKPDLAFYLQEKGIIQSPLGIAAFMMGDEYDSAEGLLKSNAVLSAYSDEESAAVNGVSVKEHVNSIVQSVQMADSGYIDDRSEESVLLKFDKLVQAEPVLRREMEKAKEPLKKLSESLTSLSDLEKRRVFSDFQSAMDQASVQATGINGSPAANGSASDSVESARGEFLAQVQFAANLLSLEGRPVRNFSLFLNMTDCDGNAVDTAAYGAEAGARVRCVSYVEGMRQLAIGLNILSQVIKNHGNVIVVVNSEGGRANGMGDSTVGFSAVMGPKDSVSSSLIADMASLDNPSSPQVRNPGAGGGEHSFTGAQLFGPDGRGITGTANVGDLQAGVARLLSEKAVRQVDLSELGNFLKIK